MTIYERIKDLASKKNISIRELENRLGFSNGTLRQWKDSTKSSSLEKVADFFGVTTDYLLGKTNIPQSGLDRFLDKNGDLDYYLAEIQGQVDYENDRLILLSSFNTYVNLQLLNGLAGNANREGRKAIEFDKKVNSMSGAEKEEIAERMNYIFANFFIGNDKLKKEWIKLLEKASLTYTEMYNKEFNGKFYFNKDHTNQPAENTADN